MTVFSDVVLGSVDSEMDFEIQNLISNINFAKTFRYIYISGKKFVPGSVIITKVDDNGPQFSKIQKIYQIGGEIYLYISEVFTQYFKHNYYAYKVFFHEEEIALFNIKLLPYVGTCLFVKIEDSYYVATRYDI